MSSPQQCVVCSAFDHAEAATTTSSVAWHDVKGWCGLVALCASCAEAEDAHRPALGAANFRLDGETCPLCGGVVGQPVPSQ